MQDRVPTKPGRVLVTPENGAAPYYAVMTRADEPTQEGTPLNKATLLSDATAAKFGFDAAGSPNDVFDFLGKYNLYWWRRRTNISSAGYIEDRTLNSVGLIILDTSGMNTMRSITYATSVSVNATTGALTFQNQRTVNVSFNTASSVHSNYFVNNYVQLKDNRGNSVWAFIPSSASVYPDGDENFISMYVANEVYVVGSKYVQSKTVTNWEYIYSANRNEYPDSGIVTNIEYDYIGIPFENITLKPTSGYTGSYHGTGTSTVMLVFPFVPKLVIIQASQDSNWRWAVFLPQSGQYILSGSQLVGTVTLSGTAMEWYYSSSAYNQLNDNNSTYRYVAFG